MLSTIKGYYDYGQIILEEPPPIKSKTEVVVTFLTEETKKMYGVKGSWGD